MSAPLHGWLILDKPVGLGSTQAVSAVKRALRRCGCPKAKVGHGGTLDPLASGVLPIAVGEATKLTGRMLDADKAYDFTIAFGTETDTLDAEGAVIALGSMRPSRGEVEAVLQHFTGPIEQVPPAYSALKVEGRRAYDLARAGEVVQLATRQVIVHDLKLLPASEARGEGEWAGSACPRHVEGSRGEPTCLLSPQASGGGVERDGAGGAMPLHHAAHGPPPQAELGEEPDAVTLSALVSKGTYIRSLARDIAHALGTVGHVSMLRRTKAGPFTLAQAVSLDKLEETATGGALQALLLPLTAGLDDIPALPVSPDQAHALRQGRRLDGAAAASGLHLAMLGTTPVALVDTGQVVRGFNLMSE